MNKKSFWLTTISGALSLLMVSAVLGTIAGVRHEITWRLTLTTAQKQTNERLSRIEEKLGITQKEKDTHVAVNH